MELSLDSTSYEFVPKSISEFVAEISAIDESSEKLLKLHGYVLKLEEERRKIEAFKRELPLSVLLVNDAIKRLKEEERVIRESAVEEFTPSKKKKKKGKSFGEEDEIGRVNSERDFSDKRSWMSSVQLWSSNSDFDLKPRRGDQEEEEDGRVKAKEEVGNYQDKGGAFVAFKAHGSSSSSSSGSHIIPSLSLMTPISAELGGSSSTTTKSNSISCPKNNAGSVSASAFFTQQTKLVAKPQPHQQNHHAFRKQRRCWSPELHRRFVHALQQIGGSQAATPKQIRDLMQVEGLTNDEVKSHLQKYRLHVRKLPNSTQGNSGSWTNQQDHSEGSSKANTNVSQSGSPQGPLLANRLSNGKARSNTGGDSTEAEEDDETSDGHSWRGRGGNSHREARIEE